MLRKYKITLQRRTLENFAWCTWWKISIIGWHVKMRTGGKGTTNFYEYYIEYSQEDHFTTIKSLIPYK